MAERTVSWRNESPCLAFCRESPCSACTFPHLSTYCPRALCNHFSPSLTLISIPTHSACLMFSHSVLSLEDGNCTLHPPSSRDFMNAPHPAPQPLLRGEHFSSRNDQELRHFT